jgi:hypothetical protein
VAVPQGKKENLFSSPRLGAGNQPTWPKKK